MGPPVIDIEEVHWGITMPSPLYVTEQRSWTLVVRSGEIQTLHIRRVASCPLRRIGRPFLMPAISKVLRSRNFQWRIPASDPWRVSTHLPNRRVLSS